MRVLRRVAPLHAHLCTAYTQPLLLREGTARHCSAARAKHDGASAALREPARSEQPETTRAAREQVCSSSARARCYAAFRDTRRVNEACE